MSIYIALSRLHMSMKFKSKLLNIWLELYFKKSVLVQVRKPENVSPLLIHLLYLTAAYFQKLWLSQELKRAFEDSAHEKRVVAGLQVTDKNEGFHGSAAAHADCSDLCLCYGDQVPYGRERNHSGASNLQQT